MPEKKNKPIQIYIVIALSLVLVIMGYFRFIHNKSISGDDHTLPAAGPAKFGPAKFGPAKFDIASIAINKPQKNSMHALPAKEPSSIYIRDIFVPLKSQADAELQFTKQTPSTTPVLPLKLKGTIVGGGIPIAIINDQFVRVGDVIANYKVVKIVGNRVVLTSGNYQKILEVLNNGKN
ncbi:MAG: hypothetical protein KAI50_05535 [Desulfobacterales bacterium]|nr:hypothetical protein [Desulfobacterales bacterium]